MKCFTLGVSVLCLALVACSGSTTQSGTNARADAGPVSGEVTSCPPAPLEDEYDGKPCHDPTLGCPYASPNSFQGKWPNICDVQAGGSCVDGKFEVGATTVMCCPTGPAQVTWCSQPITEGAPCNEPDNSECVLRDQSATCACDKPGPIWRCLPIDGGVHYCSCLGTLEPCLDAGADGGDAG